MRILIPVLSGLLGVIATTASAHEGIELGPNGGRILEFSKNETMHGEVTVKGDKFHIAVLDKDMKPAGIKEQTLAATLGDRDNPQKLAVERTAEGFTVPLVQPGQWLILQYRETPSSKPVTARLEYNLETCAECQKAEWLCACATKKDK